MFIYFLYVFIFMTGTLLGMGLALWMRAAILKRKKPKRKADKTVLRSSSKRERENTTVSKSEPQSETDTHPQVLKDKIPDKTQTLMEINCIADGVEPEQHLLKQRAKQDDAYNMLKKRIEAPGPDPESH